MNHIDNIYCINLDKSTDRRKHMIQEFTKLLSGPESVLEDTELDQPMSKAVFVRAVTPVDADFRALKKKCLDKTFSKRCFCVKSCGHSKRPLRDIEIAICLSHLNCYKKIIENGDKISMIVEDDISFHPDFDKIMDHILDNGLKNKLLSDEPIIVFVGGKTNPELSISDPARFDFYPTKNGIYSNYCSILNLAGAKVLKQLAVPIVRPDDSFKRFIIAHNKMTGLQIKPALVGELSSGINLKPIYSRFSRNTTIREFQNTVANELRNKAKKGSKQAKYLNSKDPRDNVSKKDKKMKVIGNEPNKSNLAGEVSSPKLHPAKPLGAPTGEKSKQVGATTGERSKQVKIALKPGEVMNSFVASVLAIQDNLLSSSDRKPAKKPMYAYSGNTKKKSENKSNGQSREVNKTKVDKNKDKIKDKNKGRAKDRDKDRAKDRAKDKYKDKIKIKDKHKDKQKDI